MALAESASKTSISNPPGSKEEANGRCKGWEEAKGGWRKSSVERPKGAEDRPEKVEDQPGQVAGLVLEQSEEVKEVDELESKQDVTRINQDGLKEVITEDVDNEPKEEVTRAVQDGFLKKATRTVADVLELKDPETDEEAMMGEAREARERKAPITYAKDAQQSGVFSFIMEAVRSNCVILALLALCCMLIFMQSQQFNSAQESWSAAQEFEKQEKLQLEKEVRVKDQELQDQLVRSREDMEHVLHAKERMARQLAESTQTKTRLKARVDAAETRAVELQEKIDDQAERWEHEQNKFEKNKVAALRLRTRLETNSKLLKQDSMKEDRIVQTVQSQMQARDAKAMAWKQELDKLRSAAQEANKEKELLKEVTTKIEKQQKQLAKVRERASKAEAEVHRSRSENLQLQSHVLEQEAELKEQKTAVATVQDEILQERNKYKASENLRKEDAKYTKHLEDRIKAQTTQEKDFNRTLAEKQEQALQIRLDASLIEQLQQKLNRLQGTEDQARAEGLKAQLQHLHGSATEAEISSNGDEAESDEFQNGEPEEEAESDGEES